MGNNSPTITLNIVGRNGKSQSVSCDSVRLNACDNNKGKNGGSLGIRKGHLKSLIALSPSTVEGYLKDELVFSAEISGGIASVENDIVTVFSDN